MTPDEAISALLAFIFSGALGSSKGKGVGYALVESTPTTFSWWAALEDIDGPPVPIDRYLVKINRRTRTILPPEPIALSNTELSEAILSATGHHLASSTRFTDGALSISYKVTVQESPDIAYVVQLRHHGNVASMDSLMGLISKTAGSHVLPVPPVYPIPGERRRQDVTGLGRQITLFKPGLMAEMTYPGIPHDEKLRFVRKIALAIRGLLEHTDTRASSYRRAHRHRYQWGGCSQRWTRSTPQSRRSVLFRARVPPSIYQVIACRSREAARNRRI